MDAMFRKSCIEGSESPRSIWLTKPTERSRVFANSTSVIDLLLRSARMSVPTDEIESRLLLQ